MAYRNKLFNLAIFESASHGNTTLDLLLSTPCPYHPANKRRSQLAIRSIFVDGVWSTDPNLIKNAFFNHFATRFQEPPNFIFKINFVFPNKLHHNQTEDLERHVSHDEIKRAVWDCGDNKSPGPDGFTFEFFKTYWDLVGQDFCAAVQLA
uniref:RNA-directed DNA polymerase, eukaryota n=1 Tax=Tanacetum cinerariifolium TaxID=118510 RepID=A0A699KCE5_TANCI|nr:RNA-directed DNA polymerase, eukaryota [Tanacetum cinerariifolium]